MHSATNLERLNLSFMDLTDAAFTTEPSDRRNGFYVMGRALRSLDLTQAHVTDVALAALSTHCRLLEDVKLSSCSEVTDVGVETLVRSCSRLRSLDLNNCGLVTDRGVGALGAYAHRLERVNLSWCLNITDKAIADVARGCERLEDAQFVWCTQLTDGAIDAFLEALARREASTENRLQVHVTGCKGVTQRKIDEARDRGLCVVATLS